MGVFFLTPQFTTKLKTTEGGSIPGVYFVFLLFSLYSFLRFMHICIFGRSGSSLLCASFLQFCGAGVTLFVRGLCSGFLVGAQAPGSQPPVVLAPRLSCFAACGIFPDQGSNLCPLYSGFSTTGLPGKPFPTILAQFTSTEMHSHLLSSWQK